jgi:hypothetical protein
MPLSNTRRQALVDDLDRAINPPPEPQPSVVYVEQSSEGSPRLGDPDFNADLWKRRR